MNTLFELTPMSVIWVILAYYCGIFILMYFWNPYKDGDTPSRPPEYISTSNPAFQHTCPDCTFLGHYLEYDIYVHGNYIYARFGSENYKQRFEEINKFISVMINRPDYAFCETSLGYHRAMMLALLAYYSNTKQKPTWINKPYTP